MTTSKMCRIGRARRLPSRVSLRRLAVVSQIVTDRVREERWGHLSRGAQVLFVVGAFIADGSGCIEPAELDRAMADEELVALACRLVAGAERIRDERPPRTAARARRVPGPF